jgi:glycogen debranching enzyme
MQKNQLDGNFKMNRHNYERLHKYIEEIIPKLQHEANGYLTSPFLSVSCGQHYANAIYAWDNHHMSMRLAYGGHPEYFRHLIDALAHYQGADGFIPSIVGSGRGPMHSSPRFHAQPFLMQGMAMYLELTGDKPWVTANYPKLKKYLEYWKNVHSAPFGLFYWGASWMGFDNDISSSIMLPETVITPDLCSWIYLEYLAAAQIAAVMNWSDDTEKYRLLAAELKKQINTILWNEKAQSYCAYNVRIGKQLFAYGDLTGEHFIGNYAFQSCSNLIPLYARIASPEQAKAMIEKYVIAPEHFWSEYGVRSLSRSSEYYNNALWGNPGRYSEQHRLTNSNWQGPIWIPICYFVFHALRHYGFTSKAEELAANTVNLLASSLDHMGSFAENYDGDTGKPLYCIDFASWNILADQMPKERSSGKWIMDTVFKGNKR